MRNRVPKDLACVIGIYGAYAAAIVGFYGLERFAGDSFEGLPLVMLAISFACFALWYVLGQWVIRPNALSHVWYAWWAVLLAIVVGAASWISLHETAVANQNDNTDAIAIPWLHFLGGVGCFYLASVLFSPLVARFRIWPARFVRSW